MMIKDRQGLFSDMSLEELWQLFPVFLTKRRPVWMQWYQEERERLSGILPMEDICEISHVRSTSIPSIWAESIVDILVEMRECGDIQAMKEHIIGGGCICMMEKAGRTSFNRGHTPLGFTEKVFHLHPREVGNNDELYFRDYLRKHPEAAREYEELKLGLRKECEHDRDGYTEQKKAVMERFTREAKNPYLGRYKRQAPRSTRAELEDTEALRQLARASEAHWGYGGAFMENFDAGFNVTEDFIRRNPVHTAGECGCSAAFWGIRQDRDAWELEYFYAAEERLGRGLRKQMWERTTGWCGKQEICRIHFVISPQAVGFYEKMSAVRDGKTRSPVDGHPVPHFVYDL